MVNASPEGADSDVILQLLGQVSDPEVPVLSILDLGIVRSWQQDENGVEVVITPTYSGCPAMDTIEADIRKTFREAGYPSLEVRTVLDPPWTTDWMSEEGKEKLRAYGIAPPEVYQLIVELARLEGVVLDPVYTGKAFYGLLKDIQDGYFDGVDDIIFIHTGGVFGLFAHDQPLTHAAS